MLEVRYNKNTGQVTGWWGNLHGNHEAKLRNRPDEVIAVIDYPVPKSPPAAWFCNGLNLTTNPDYIEEPPAKSVEQQITDLRQELKDRGVL